MSSPDEAREAVKLTEEYGIIFLDELDKIANPRSHFDHGPQASAEGVQRDLLPLIEGSTISTKYGPVNTSHILFIASGAFSSVKPSDLLSELQGRLPIRVHLNDLTEEDFYRILTETENNLIKQQKMLLETEGVNLKFTKEAIREIARVARQANTEVDNIGARRLHTVIERVMDDISFDAADTPGKEIVVTKELIQQKVTPLLQKGDIRKYIL
eukprot:TRINITY_DN9364_c0_g1_i1.p1 TRINITY_DN9364_c0_g1~~TRINITY_DN9364_c0_g1_i1.p1  ORF type:complete len:226 (+),score=48.02 TRINITY_DN9364_c0_g1_i1:42-680(+)